MDLQTKGPLSSCWPEVKDILLDVAKLYKEIGDVALEVVSVPMAKPLQIDFEDEQALETFVCQLEGLCKILLYDLNITELVLAYISAIYN